MRLLHEIAIFQTVKSKVIISLFETVKLSVSFSLKNLFNSLNSIKEIVSNLYHPFKLACTNVQEVIAHPLAFAAMLTKYQSFTLKSLCHGQGAAR